MTIDHAVFDWINQGWANPFFDAVLPVVRNKLTWVPAYLVLLVWLFRKHGWRRTLVFLILVGAVLGLADQLAATIIKPWVGRLRPCADAEVAERARILISCGGKFSFPSNHATNHFALATLLIMTVFRNASRWWIYGLLGWAGLISVAQVYVGKHFPLDILFGGVLGAVIAIFGALLYRKLIPVEMRMNSGN